MKMRIGKNHPVRKTRAFKQMKAYINYKHKGFAESTRRKKLNELVRKFMRNYEAQHPGVPITHKLHVDQAFVWANTEEGHNFWSEIDAGLWLNEEDHEEEDEEDAQPVWREVPVPQVKAPDPEQPKEAPARKVGWW